MEKDVPVLVFDDSSKDRILKALGLKRGKDSVLIGRKGKIQTNDRFEEISFSEFGGVLRGSKLLIKKDTSDLARYFTNRII